MKKRQKGWFFPPEKPPKHDVPENVKIEVETKASELVESFLKPEYIKPPREDKPFNYIVDIYPYRHDSLGFYKNAIKQFLDYIPSLK